MWYAIVSLWALMTISLQNKYDREATHSHSPPGYKEVQADAALLACCTITTVNCCNRLQAVLNDIYNLHTYVYWLQCSL